MNSLATTVLKDKYFKKKNLLEAKLGRGSSLIWRNLLSTLDLLKEGLRWRVGNGQDISIWGHKWLQTPSNFCIQSPIMILGENPKVRE